MNWENARELIEEYLWVMGISMFGAGIAITYKNGTALIGIGLLIAAIGIYLNTIKKSI